MNIDRFKYYAAVVETKNLRKAADLVGITPGSMSKAISALEEELSIKLLRPEGRGIEITEGGYRVYHASAILLDEFRRFSDKLKQPKTDVNTSKLRIGTFEVFSTYFVTALLEKEFRDEQVLILELTPGNIEKSIEEGLIQYGFTYLPSPSAKLDFVEVGSFEMGIFGLKRWEKVAFKDWPFAIPITPLKINALEHTSLDMWPKNKPRFVKYEFELLETALQTSRAGLSVLYCPNFIVALHNRQISPEHKLIRLESPPGIRSIRTKIYLVTLKGNSKRLSIEGKVAKFLRSL